MKTLQQCQWKTFRIEDLFDVKRGNAKDVTTRSMNGNIALVTAIDSNNAVSGTTEALNNETIFPPSLTIHNNGNGVGLVFVHNYRFLATSDVSVLSLKEGNFNPVALRFLIPIIQRQRSKFDYGYKLANNRLKYQVIMLPVTPNGMPDYQFMEEYMREKECMLLEKYQSHIEGKIEEVLGGA